jgi:hypothetical protein
VYSRSKQVSYTCIYNLKQNIVQDKKTFILHLYIKTEVIGQQWRLQRSEIMESVKSDGQQFQQYQPNDLSPLNFTH